MHGHACTDTHARTRMHGHACTDTHARSTCAGARPNVLLRISTGSKSIDDCLCDRGYYKNISNQTTDPNSTEVDPCAYPTGDATNFCVQCPEHSTTGGSISVSRVCFTFDAVVGHDVLELPCKTVCMGAPASSQRDLMHPLPARSEVRRPVRQGVPVRQHSYQGAR
jgi:hypothetical protein